MRAVARRWGFFDRSTTATLWPASSRISASRGAWSDARTMRAPSCATLRSRPAADRPAQRQIGFAPPEQVARTASTASHRDIGGRLRLPGQLERPRGHEPGLPRSRRQIRRGPVLRQFAGIDQLGPPLIGLAPQECGGLRDVARLVQDCRIAPGSTVEAGRRCEARRPDLRGIADLEGARLAWPVGHGPQRIVRRPRDGRGHGSRSDSRDAARPRRSRIAPTPSSGAGTRMRCRSTIRSTLPVVRWSVGSNDRSESISSPKNSIRWAGPSRAGTRRRCHPAARTTRRPGHRRSPGGTGHGATRPGGAAADPQLPGSSGRSSGAIVRARPTLATRTRARPCRQAERAATGRRSRATSRCARRPAPSADPAQRPAPDRAEHSSSSATRSPISASRAIQTMRSSSECRSEVRLGTVWHGHDAGVAADAADIAGEPSRSRMVRNEPVSARSGGSTDRSGSR